MNAAVGVVAAALTGISAAYPNVDPDRPDLAGNIKEVGEDTVAAVVVLPTGDCYRITVEWLREESP